jgi:hypothetical protein
MIANELSFLDVEQFSMEVSEGNIDLEYSDEDVKPPCIFVLFCPCKTLQDETMIKYTDFDDPRTYIPFFLPLFFFLFFASFKFSNSIPHTPRIPSSNKPRQR